MPRHQTFVVRVVDFYLKGNVKTIAFSTLLARCLILLSWKKVAPPSHRRWVEEVMSYLKLERLKHTIRGSTQRYYTVWQPFLSYFEREFLKQ